jgi:hypothetical protein
MKIYCLRYRSLTYEEYWRTDSNSLRITTRRRGVNLMRVQLAGRVSTEISPRLRLGAQGGLDWGPYAPGLFYQAASVGLAVDLTYRLTWRARQSDAR